MPQDQTLASLKKQLEFYSARKLTPESKRSKNPAQAIDAMASARGSVYKVQMVFKLTTKPQMNWFDGQELVYKTTCPECRKRKITVKTTYLKRDAIWPPEDGYPDRCETCQGGEA